jgi:hypothetical protein
MIGLTLFFCIPVARAQDHPSDTVPAKIINGDTIPLVDVKPYVAFPPSEVKTRKAAMRYDKLVYNVRKVYPYARLAGQKFLELKAVYDTIQGEKERKAYIKKAQQQIEDQFGDEIRDLTFSQGKILIKLIYRQTGNSSYEIVRELRGKFTAFIFQTLAGVFGYDLKAPYDPGSNPDDNAIERIVILIDEGAI